MMRLIVCAAELVCERQVARLGDAQGGLDRLEVAQLADQDHVGILAERGAQRVGEPLRVLVDFALVDQAALVLVDELDRVLDGEDVLVPLGVDLVDHRRQRRRLARAGGTGDQDQPARTLGQIGQHLRQAELAEALDDLGDDAVDGGDGAALVEHVAAEARDAADAERKVQLQRFLEPLLLQVGEDAVDQPLGLGRAERRQVERLEVPVDADLRRRVGRDVQIRSVVGDERLEQFG
jgi:hypothetical protein